jgi:predicted transcriptional regulator
VGLVLQGHELKKTTVGDVMEPSFPVVDPETTIDSITDLLRGEAPAVFVRMGDQDYEILTKYDVVHTIAGLSEMATGA